MRGGGGESKPRRGRLWRVDPLEKDDIERAKRMSPEERMRAVFDAVNTGVRIRLAALRAKYPEATEGEIDAKLREWLREERADD